MIERVLVLGGCGGFGYDVTIVSGIVTYRNGEATGELPGELVRGQRHLDGSQQVIAAE